MEKRRWKENPKYSEDDLLYRIAEAVGDIPAPLDADYGDVLSLAEFLQEGPRCL